jgi:nitroreductase
MDVKESIAARRSIRKYEQKRIPTETIEELLEAARMAPSSSNLQAWRIIVVTDDSARAKLVSVSGNQRFVSECSAYLIGVAESEYNAIDIAIAFDHISLRALELGLGTCWIGDFDPPKLKEILGIPHELHVPICMTLGYPAQKPHASQRKPLPELFFRDKWGTKWE